MVMPVSFSTSTFPETTIKKLEPGSPLRIMMSFFSNICSLEIFIISPRFFESILRKNGKLLSVWMMPAISSLSFSMLSSSRSSFLECSSRMDPVQPLQVIIQSGIWSARSYSMMILVRSQLSILQLSRCWFDCTTVVLIKELSPSLSMKTAIPETVKVSPYRYIGQCRVSDTRNVTLGNPMGSL